MAPPSPPGLLMLGTGEYTTGFTGAGAADSDKGGGVVAIVALHLKAKGLVGRVGMCGTDGRKLPAVRAHVSRVMAQYSNVADPACVETWPADGVVDSTAYAAAVASFSPGDIAVVFTPDATHAAVCAACVARGMHVLVAKPAVKTLAEHLDLAAAAAARGVLAAVEVHKRFDPLYADAADRARAQGPFSYFYAYMSQPKHQLETFRRWAAETDISYYLNAHHVDFLTFVLGSSSRPTRVSALRSTGAAAGVLGEGTPVEDTITLSTEWENRGAGAGTLGHAVFTSSWVAARSDAHSQQRWFYMGRGGEITMDQAHRGYTAATDERGSYSTVNPLFWKPLPSRGRFVGDLSYGYRSISEFVAAAAACNAGTAAPADFDGELATLASTAAGTAVLEAGRRSLDAGGARMEISYGADGRPAGIAPAP